MISVVVDNRVRVDVREIGSRNIEALTKLFEHVNPAFATKQALGIPVWNEPRTHTTWEWDARNQSRVSFPRGGMQRVRAYLKGERLIFTVKDERARGDADAGVLIPDTLMDLWPYQREMVDAAVARENCYLRAGTGCLVGSTVVTINRAGKGAKMKLSHVVQSFNGGRPGNARGWTPGIITYIRAPMPDGSVRLCPVQSARASGMKPVYALVDQFGHRIVATECHLFLTPVGWKRLDALEVGDYVMVDGGKDRNARNNEPENLEVLSHDEHRREHFDLAFANITARLEPAVIQSIEYAGEQETFDLEVERASAFIADGIAVHNSGKTCAALGLIARLKVPSLVLLPNVSLLEQWQERARVELGMKADEVGIIRGSKWKLRPLTLGLPQTLSARADRIDELRYFGAVLMDEIQIAAAKTFYSSIDMMPARYRVGISADERRKDKREYLTHDLFGDEPAMEVGREWLVEKGYVLDVEIKVVPTDFRADWYGLPAEEKELDFNRLLAEMLADADRQALVYGLVKRLVVDGGQQAIVFAARREHCLVLDREITGMGVRSGFLIGGDDYRVEFRRSVDGLKSKALAVGVGTYQGSGTGLDLPKVGLGIGVTPIAGNKQFFNQVRGRLCRIAHGKKSACLVYLLDVHVYPNHLRNLVAWNKTVTVLEGERWVEARKSRLWSAIGRSGGWSV